MKSLNLVMVMLSVLCISSAQQTAAVAANSAYSVLSRIEPVARPATGQTLYARGTFLSSPSRYFLQMVSPGVQYDGGTAGVNLPFAYRPFPFVGPLQGLQLNLTNFISFNFDTSGGTPVANNNDITIVAFAEGTYHYAIVTGTASKVVFRSDFFPPIASADTIDRIAIVYNVSPTTGRAFGNFTVAGRGGFFHDNGTHAFNYSTTSTTAPGGSHYYNFEPSPYTPPES